MKPALILLFASASLATAAVDWRAELSAGKASLQRRAYDEAASHFADALTALGDANDPAVLDAIRSLASVRRLQGDFDSSAKLLEQAVARSASAGDPGQRAGLLSEFAAANRASGKLDAARAAYGEAIAIRQSADDANQEELAKDLTALGAILVRQEDAEAAVETLRLAVAAWDRAVPPDSPMPLPAIEALGVLLRGEADYEGAEPLWRRSLRLRELAFGPESAELIPALDSLAYVEFGLANYAEAEPLYKRLLSVWENTAGAEHPMVALTLDKMGEFYAAQQRYAEAEALVSRALALRGAAHLQSYSQTGRILIMQAKLVEAAELYRNAVVVGDTSGISDQVMDPPLRIYASLLRQTNKADEADAVEKRIRAAIIRRGDREGRRDPDRPSAPPRKVGM